MKMNFEELIKFYWKCNEINISQYIPIQWKNIAIRFSRIVTPLIIGLFYIPSTWLILYGLSIRFKSIIVLFQLSYKVWK